MKVTFVLPNNEVINAYSKKETHKAVDKALSYKNKIIFGKINNDEFVLINEEGGVTFNGITTHKDTFKLAFFSAMDI